MIIVVAMGENRVIGRDNKMPWHISSDLKRFKRLTINSTVIMGKNTFLSIGKPLEDRKNIVLSRDTNFKPHGCKVVDSIDYIIDKYKEANDVFVIGGSQIYRLLLPFVKGIELTLIHSVFEGDTYFPKLDDNQWRENKREYNNPKNGEKYSYSFVSLERIKNN